MQFQSRFLIRKLAIVSTVIVQGTSAWATITKTPELRSGTPVVEKLWVKAKTSIQIKNDNGSIVIVGNDSEQMEIQATYLGAEVGARLAIVDNESGKVQIQVSTPSSNSGSRSFSMGGIVVNSMVICGGGAATDLVVSVPRTLVANLKIETGGSDIQIEGLEGVRSFAVNGGSSNVSVSNVKADYYSVNVGSGHSSFSHSSGTAEINSGSGGSHFLNHVGDMNSNSGSGQVRAVDTHGDISFNTGSGSIEVARNRGSVVQIRSGRGAITVTEQEGGEIQLESQQGGQTTTNNPEAVYQTVVTPAPLRYRDLTGKWSETRMPTASYAGMSVGGDTVIVNGRVVTGAEAERVRQQVLRSMGAAFGNINF